MESNTMSPWDENSWFNTPKVSNIVLSNVNQTSILKANPQRIGIIFSAALTSAANIIRLGLDDTNAVYALTQVNTTQFVLQSFYGSLPAMEWFAMANAVGITLFVTELVLRSWPQADYAQQQSQQAKISQQIQALVNQYATRYQQNGNAPQSPLSYANLVTPRHYSSR